MSHPVAVLAIADASLRQKLGQTLSGLRWQVIEASGGAEALAELESGTSKAMVLGRWLPDLDVQEFFREVQATYPDVDLVSVDGSLQSTGRRNPRHGELMHAIRLCQEWDGTPHLNRSFLREEKGSTGVSKTVSNAQEHCSLKKTMNKSFEERGEPGVLNLRTDACDNSAARDAELSLERQEAIRLPEFLGSAPAMLEVSRRIRLVAPRLTSVLVQGPSGTGKELVARAIHRLSPRAHKPFVVLNCAAIPESLLEAELFGHTRGAFTGAVQGRMGRIESAQGGTLFLDEIGEMPLALQAKLLRFLEAGEIQRVGDNETITVDVRVVAATHQPLAERARLGTFREDVFYRLAVFLIKTPALREHSADIPILAEMFLRRLAQEHPAKRLPAATLEVLQAHSWPGNVRELAHVLERGYILAEDRMEILPQDIEFEVMPGLAKCA